MKRSITIIILSAALITVSILYFFKVNADKNTDNQQAKNDIQEKAEVLDELVSIDSLLLTRDYRSALNKYQNLSDEFKNDSLGLTLRMEIVKRLQRLENNSFVSEPISINADSLSSIDVPAKLEVRDYDSLDFAYRKAQIQIDRLQRLLQQKTSGEYLTFKSSKGNQLHYVGQVSGGKANGTGIAILETGSRYEGQWKNNEKHGFGKFYWADGQRYEGEFENDLRKGKGTYFWTNGETYVGNWKDDKRDGKGKMYAPDGTIIASGTWENDKLVTTN